MRTQICSILLTGLFVSGCVTGGTSLQTENFTISHAAITSEQAEDVARKSEVALRQLSDLLGRKPDGKVLILIRDFKDSMRPLANTLNREIEIPARRLGLKNRRSGIVHEIAHIVAGRPFSGSRVLSEGFAVYAEDKFSTELSGEAHQRYEPHNFVRTRVIPQGRLISLNELYFDGLAFSNRHQGFDARVGRLTAYFQAGSLVKYLIDTYGIEKFKQYYYDAPISDVYGKTLAQIELEWLQFLRSK